MNVVHQILTATTLAVIFVKVAPLLLASIGGAITQQGNILNIGLEGMMLIGGLHRGRHRFPAPTTRRSGRSPRSRPGSSSP